MTLKTIALALALFGMTLGVTTLAVRAQYLGGEDRPAVQAVLRDAHARAVRSDPTAFPATLSAQTVLQRVGRPPEEAFLLFDTPCALWTGGYVRDSDPYFKRFGGKRATWSLQLCWSGPSGKL